MVSTGRGGEALVLGVDVGGTAIKAGIVGTGGELVSSFHGPSPRTTGELHDFVHSILGSSKHSLRGIGVGCKGIINPESTLVECLPGDLHFLEGQYLSEVIAQPQDLPVCADNDARTALIAEVLWGAARGARNVVMLTLGTGVGGAVLLNGTILRGTAGVAGHLGHVTVDARGELCICGNYGCLETVFSSRAIESAYWAHLHRAVPTTLCADAGRLPDTEAIFRAAAAGDECARYVVNRAQEYLTAALVGFLHTFDPEILILGGNIAAAGPSLLDPIKDNIARRTKTMLRREVPIVFQKTIGYGGVTGAAGLVFLEQKLMAI
jgi:glucokinase